MTITNIEVAGARRQEVEALAIMDAIDLWDEVVMAGAWRRGDKQPQLVPRLSAASVPIPVTDLSEE